jgi:hypothetical protein
MNRNLCQKTKKGRIFTAPLNSLTLYNQVKSGAPGMSRNLDTYGADGASPHIQGKTQDVLLPARDVRDAGHGVI